MTTTMLILEKENITVDLEFEPHPNYYKDPVKYDYFLGATLKFTVMVNGRLKRCNLDVSIRSKGESDNPAGTDEISVKFGDKYALYEWDYKRVVGALSILYDFGYFSSEELSTRLIQEFISNTMQIPTTTLPTYTVKGFDTSIKR